MQDDSSTNKPVILSRIGGINAKATGVTNLYTVPVGKTAIITGVVFRCTQAASITGVPTIGVGVAAGEADVMPATQLTNFNALNRLFVRMSAGHIPSAIAQQVIKAGIDAAAVGTSMTIEITLLGYLI